jgi:DNA-binding NarL/FixJ family response regulator
VKARGVCGFEVIRRIRLQLGLSRPIIAISVHPADEMRHHALKARCTEYLSKSMDLDQFIADFD